MKFVCLVVVLTFSILLTGCSRDSENITDRQFIQNYDENGHSRRTLVKGIPQRVLILYPGAAEVMLELGLDAHILQTIAAYGSEPEHLRQRFAALPKVKAAFIPAQEEVFALQPDLIIGWAHNFSPMELGAPQGWQERGIGAYIVPATIPHERPTLENSVYPFLEDLGKIFAVEDRATGYIAACRQKENAVSVRLQNRERETAIVLQDHGRSSYSLYDAGYLINDVLDKAGLDNLVTMKTSIVGPERILAYDPDYLVYVSLPGPDGQDLSDEEVLAQVRQNRDLQPLRAVQQGKIINISFAEVNSGNGRALDALFRLADGRLKYK
ncbi:ABC transporter substrate-binding protein [Selenomonas ruminantium]|uniref:Iron complex transport system substrate-binding protein n=1 Tax=Selenomonas ruminantium TaxID=971 RepID=A0A1I0V0Y8_SELRU|nr:ABC transporter substrate-binding protein [Selenomonas ruminantium]SFA69793.1 iron complex transport system substrate-binding protein [Selenomonas ruminantium]